MVNDAAIFHRYRPQQQAALGSMYDSIRGVQLVAWSMWLLLGGCLAGVVPGSLLVPFADRGWPPDWLSADTAVSLGHLLACNVGTHCGWGDAEKARNVAGCPPVLGKRL